MTKPTYNELQLALSEQRAELSEVLEDNISKDYEILRLTHTISALQDDMIKAFNDSKLEVMVLQKKLDGRILQ